MSEVDDFVKKIEPGQRKIVQKLRDIVKNTIPDSTEALKWSAPNFIVKKKLFASVHNYSDHVNFYFVKGAVLKSKLLEGTGKGLRHIKIKDYASIPQVELKRLLKEAEKLV